MATEKSKKPAEYDSDNLNRQRQTEGTPREFDGEEARETSRNMVGGREHMSELDDEDFGDEIDDEVDNETEEDFDDDEE